MKMNPFEVAGYDYDPRKGLPRDAEKNKRHQEYLRLKSELTEKYKKGVAALKVLFPEERKAGK